jgi:peptidoglycan hydrolase-like protein with peptidoglycan-binding domain
MRAHRFVISSISAALLSCGALFLLSPELAVAQTGSSNPATPAAKIAPSSTASTTKTASGATTKAAPPKRVGTRSASARRRASRTRPPMAPTPARISEIQSALAAQGSYKGQPNGKWDDSTVQAMKEFQSAHGLTPTGKLDALSLQKLGLGSEIAGRAAPLRQTPAAPASSQQQTP